LLELTTALRSLPGLTESVEAARANQTQAETRWRAGLGNVVELADAESLLTNAELEAAIGHFAVARARASLGRVMADDPVSLRSPGVRP
jgi:outer membrane protein